MKTFLNVLWHFPFFGFLSATAVFIYGCILCLTIVGIPIGLGLIQFSKFLYHPFGYAMIDSRKFVAATSEKSGNELYDVFALLIRILYFPFGLTMCICAAVEGVACCVTIIGIPVGVVIFKSLGTYFNPIYKMCVTSDIANAVATYNNAIKAGQKVEKPEILRQYEDVVKEQQKVNFDFSAMMKKAKEYLMLTWKFVFAYKWYFLGGIALIVVISTFSYCTSDEYRMKCAHKAFNQGDYVSAADYASKIDNANSEYFVDAVQLHYYALVQCDDEKGALIVARDAYQKLANPYFGSIVGEAMVTGKYSDIVPVNYDEAVNIAMNGSKEYAPGIALHLFAIKEYSKAYKIMKWIATDIHSAAYDMIAGPLGLIYLYDLAGEGAYIDNAKTLLEYVSQYYPVYSVMAADLYRLSVNTDINFVDKAGSMYKQASEGYGVYSEMAKQCAQFAENIRAAYDGEQGGEEDWYSGSVGNWKPLHYLWGNYSYEGIVRNNLPDGWGNLMDYRTLSIYSNFSGGNYKGKFSQVKRENGKFSSAIIEPGEVAGSFNWLYEIHENGDYSINGKRHLFDPTVFTTELIDSYNMWNEPYFGEEEDYFIE